MSDRKQQPRKSAHRTSGEQPGDEWMNAYPAHARRVLADYGVPDWMDERARQFNERLIAISERFDIRGPQFEQSAAAAFKDELGGIERHVTAVVSPEQREASHAGHDFVSELLVVKALAELIEDYRLGRLRGLVGLSIDGREARFFAGGLLHDKWLDEAARILASPGRDFHLRRESSETEPAEAPAPTRGARGRRRPARRSVRGGQRSRP